jgi:hypothetical protein
MVHGLKNEAQPDREQPRLVPLQAPEKQQRRRAGIAGYRILQYTFVVIPLVAGTDKFFHLLVNWDMYLSPVARQLMGGNTHLFMQIAGATEIAVGIGMIFKPSVFSYIVSAWLLGIVINLVLTGAFFDIALRDFALALATFALGRMSDSFSHK